MTPGFAKSRAELPWLYYPENDRVIINAHNFTTPFSPIVNGKSPIAAWIPSQDTAGNGTTTLTDLVGSNNGTLTNFAMTGSTSNWVADTGSGGVRALDFDNNDDRVDTAFTIPSGPYAISWWDKTTSSTAVQGRFEIAITSNANAFAIVRLAFGGYQNISFGRWAGVNSLGAAVPSIASTVGVWSHWLITGSSITSTTLAHHAVYCNGALYAVVASGAFSNIATPDTRIGRNRANQSGNARFDDIRIFSQQLDASDASFLYASGVGRGVSA